MRRIPYSLLSVLILIISVSIHSFATDDYTSSELAINHKKNDSELIKLPLVQDSHPYTYLIDDMENIDDWFNLSCNKFLSTDCTQGNYAMEMRVNSTLQQTILKVISDVNCSQYRYLEFDLKITGTNFTGFSIEINQPSTNFDYIQWFRSYRDKQWHHVVIDLQKPMKVNMTESTFEILEFDIWGHQDYEYEEFSVLIDYVYLSSPGIRLTPDSPDKAITEGGTVEFNIELEHILGTISEDFSLSLDKTNLFELDAELSTNSISLLPNKSQIFKVTFTAPSSLSIDCAESVNITAQSTTQPNKNYTITITCYNRTYNDRVYFMSDHHNGSYDLFSINPDGTDVKRLTNDIYDEHTVVNLSPDGNLLAFTRSNNSMFAHYRELWILNLTDMTETQITHNGFADAHPDFSPDGKYVCYFANPLGKNASIRVIAINGTEMRIITPSNYLCADPAWSRNGDYIAFNGLGPGGTDTWHFEMYYANATDGSDMVRITNDNYCETDPYWSFDDECIMYDRYIGPGDWNDLNNIYSDQEPWEILEYNRTSTLETKVLETVGDNEAKYAIMPSYAPDNNGYLYARYDDEYGIFRMYIDDRKGNNDLIDLHYAALWCDWGPRRDYVARPDLNVEQISITPSSPETDDSITITATVNNTGDALLTSAKVIFTDGHPKDGGITIGTIKDITNLNSGASVQISSDELSNPSQGVHSIYVTLVNATPLEDFTLNNRDYIQINIDLDSGDDDDDDDDDGEDTNGLPTISGFNSMHIILIISLTSVIIITIIRVKLYDKKNV